VAAGGVGAGTSYSVRQLIPSTPAQFIHDPLKPWKRPSPEALEGRSVVWHTLWSDHYSNPRYAELVPRLTDLFFAPIRQRGGLFGRVDGAVARRTPLCERRVLDWYRGSGVKLLLTPSPSQATLFRGPVVVDLDDPSRTPAEQAALCAVNVRHVVVTTDSTAAYVRGSNPRLAVSIVPQGVAIDRVVRSKHAATRETLLASLDLPRDTVIVGYHAPIICLSSDAAFQEASCRTFYIDHLLTAVKTLWNSGLHFVTVLVGEVSSTIQRMASLEPRLVVKDYVDRDALFDWVGIFDIGTYPRIVDFHGRQSVKLLEYMASGAAIVAMLTTETRFLPHSGAGYAVADQEAFCKGLRTLITDSGERRQLGERGRALAMRYDWSVLANKYDAILAATLNLA
jgi:hypothetical protein